MQIKYNLIAGNFSSSREKPWQEMMFLFDYINDSDKVLDLGCGNGRFCEIISSKANYVGLDNSERLIALAKNRYPNVDFVVADATDIPFADNSFDKVYSIALLHHIASEDMRQRVLSEIKRVLRPDGLAVITVWDLWSKPKRKRSIIWQSFLSFLGLSKLDLCDVMIEWQGVRDFYFHCFSPYSFKRLIKESGFSIVKDGRITSKRGANLYVIAKKDRGNKEVYQKTSNI